MPIPDLNPILEQLELDPFARGLQIIEARELTADAFPRLDTDRPALVFALDSSHLKEIARTLRVNYPASHSIALVQNNRVKHLALDALSARTSIGRKTILYVPPLPHPGSPLTVANIMARLRAPEGGCPWDLEQTHESITRALVEETYEVIEAIADKDTAHLKEELGDLLLHVLFQTQIARDADEFALNEVGAELAAKLIRRHPHVFGDEQAQDASWVLDNWEKIKQEEKKHKGETASGNALDAGIPRHLPALTRAQKISERARRRKLSPAGTVLTPALTRALKQKRAVQRERAYGQLLLALAAYAEKEGIDAERALHAASKGFVEKNFVRKNRE
jgi:tetrapyrrole methylase family protein/MazG family protein